MELNAKLPNSLSDVEGRDPREQLDLEGGTLTSRNVLPQVTQRNPVRESLGMVGGLILVGLVGGVTLSAMQSSRERLGQPQGVPANVAASPAPVPPMQAAVSPNTVPPGTVMPGAMPPNGTQAGVPGAPPLDPAATGAANNQAFAPIVIYDNPALPSPASPGGASAGGAAPQAQTASATGGTQDDFASRLGGVGGSAAVASANFDPRNTVTQGTLIPAVLETAINTDVPGYVRAVVSVDVRSFDGRRVLVPRSSRLIGQYKSGLQAGQKRAYVIWTRLIRPDGVSVNLNSPAIGFGGETGLAGRVNTHFFERFGSAILLSVIGGLAAGSGNAGVVIASGGQSAAAAAIGQTGQIGPTIRVRQGQPIRVFTARDLDFSKAEVR